MVGEGLLVVLDQSVVGMGVHGQPKPRILQIIWTIPLTIKPGQNSHVCSVMSCFPFAVTEVYHFCIQKEWKLSLKLNYDGI